MLSVPPGPGPAPTIDDLQKQHQSLLYRGVVLAQRTNCPFLGNMDRCVDSSKWQDCPWGNRWPIVAKDFHFQ